MDFNLLTKFPRILRTIELYEFSWVPGEVKLYCSVEDGVKWFALMKSTIFEGETGLLLVLIIGLISNKGSGSFKKVLSELFEYIVHKIIDRPMINETMPSVNARGHLSRSFPNILVFLRWTTILLSLLKSWHSQQETVWDKWVRVRRWS